MLQACTAPLHIPAWLAPSGHPQGQLDGLKAAVAAGDPYATRAAVQQVYALAPDCDDAQAAEAQVEMQEGNFEQVRPWLAAGLAPVA